MGSSRPQQIQYRVHTWNFLHIIDCFAPEKKGIRAPSPLHFFFLFFGVNQRNRHDRGVRPDKSNTYIPDIEKLFLIFAGFALSTNNTGQQTPSCLVRHAAAVAAVDERLGTWLKGNPSSFLLFFSYLVFSPFFIIRDLFPLFELCREAVCSNAYRDLDPSRPEVTGDNKYMKYSVLRNVTCMKFSCSR